MTATSHECAWEELPNGQVRCFECDAVKPTTAAERKRRQRELDAKEGIREVTVRVPAEGAEKVRELAARLMRERQPK